MSERPPRRERQHSAPAPSEVDRFLAILQEDYLEPLARAAPPRPPPVEADPPATTTAGDIFIGGVATFNEDDETVVDEPQQPRNTPRERGGRPSQRQASGRESRRAEQTAPRVHEERQRHAQQQAQPQDQGYRNPGPQYQHPMQGYPVPHVIQLPYYTPHAPHAGAGLNLGQGHGLGLGVMPPPPRYDPVPVGTYVVRLARAHGRPVVGIWRASGGGRWTPVINLEGAVGEVVLLPLQEN